MIIRCRKCETRFRFDETLIRGDGVWVRCSRCQNVFFQERPSGELPSAGPAAAHEVPTVRISDAKRAPDDRFPQEGCQVERARIVPDEEIGPVDRADELPYIRRIDDVRMSTHRAHIILRSDEDHPGVVTAGDLPGEEAEPLGSPASELPSGERVDEDATATRGLPRRRPVRWLVVIEAPGDRGVPGKTQRLADRISAIIDIAHE